MLSNQRFGEEFVGLCNPTTKMKALHNNSMCSKSPTLPPDDRQCLIGLKTLNLFCNCSTDFIGIVFIQGLNLVFTPSGKWSPTQLFPLIKRYFFFPRQREYCHPPFLMYSIVFQLPFIALVLLPKWHWRIYRVIKYVAYQYSQNLQKILLEPF